jgi:septal ring factor EnvC (AmiA/AmiB activator)
MGGLFSKPDNSAAYAQIEEQKKENERLKEQATAEQRDLAEQAAARTRSRTRGGSRMLLSDTRLNPETGLMETLGGNTGKVGS